jgi:hypothetical protein
MAKLMVTFCNFANAHNNMRVSGNTTTATYLSIMKWRGIDFRKQCNFCSGKIFIECKIILRWLCKKCSFAFGFMAIALNQWCYAYEIWYYLHILHDILFVIQQSQTWWECKSLKLYPQLNVHQICIWDEVLWEIK